MKQKPLATNSKKERKKTLKETPKSKPDPRISNSPRDFSASTPKNHKSKSPAINRPAFNSNTFRKGINSMMDSSKNNPPVGAYNNKIGGQAQNMVFYHLKKYREKANRERFILPENEEIKLFSDTIKKSIEFFKK